MAEPNPSPRRFWAVYLFGLLIVGAIVFAAVVYYVLPTREGPAAMSQDPPVVNTAPPAAPELVKDNTAGTVTPQSTAAGNPPEGKPAASFPT